MARVTYIVTDPSGKYEQTRTEVSEDLAAGGRAKFNRWIRDGAKGTLDLSDPGLPLKIKKNPSLGEMARGTGRAVKRAGARAKGWYKQRQATAAAKRERARDPESVQVWRGQKLPEWFTSTHLAGELARDTRPDGKWYRKIVARLGEPRYPWDRIVPETEEEWYELEEWMNEYYLSWPDGLHATLYYRRLDEETLKGEWAIGAEDGGEAEAVRRVKALFKTKRKVTKKATKKKTTKRKTKKTKNPRVNVRSLVAKAMK